jgi:hypothetical protein
VAGEDRNVERAAPVPYSMKRVPLSSAMNRASHEGPLTKTAGKSIRGAAPNRQRSSPAKRLFTEYHPRTLRAVGGKGTLEPKTNGHVQQVVEAVAWKARRKCPCSSNT